jgi:hypothetical protein
MVLEELVISAPAKVRQHAMLRSSTSSFLYLSGILGSVLALFVLTYGPVAFQYMETGPLQNEVSLVSNQTIYIFIITLC